MTDIATGSIARTAGRHPLAVLRARAGHTHGGFARLVAETHAALGYGHMAARREKVSRWESGRATPEHTAQLAMAHLMSVPDDEVVRRGWPHWLHLATGDAQALELPWRPESVAEALDDAVRDRPGERPDYLMVEGAASTRLLRDWRAGLDSCDGSNPARPTADGATVRAFGAMRDRLGALISFDAHFTADWLSQAATVELRSLTTVLRDLGSDPVLLRLAADGAVLCGRLARQAGDHLAAQRYHLAALRAATAAGDVALSQAVLGLHVGQYIDLGAADEALALAEGAWAVRDMRTGPRVTALLHTRMAAALVLAGDDPGAAAAESAARGALRRGGPDPASMRAVDTAWIDLALGSAHVRAGRPDRAVRRFDRLLAGADRQRPPLQTARYLRDAAEALCAIGRDAAAAAAMDRADQLLGSTRSDPPARAVHTQLSYRA